MLSIGSLNGRTVARFSQEAINIPLSPAIPRSSSGNLYLEFTVRKDRQDTPPYVWFIDMEEIELGKYVVLGRSCWKKPGDIQYSKLILTTTNGAAARLAGAPLGFDIAMIYSRDANKSVGEVYLNRSLVMQLRDG